MKKIFTIITLGSFFAPSFVLGMTPNIMHYTQEEVSSRNIATTTPITSSSSTKLLTDFCSQIDKILVTVDGKVITREDNRIEVMNKKTEKRDNLRTQIDTLRKQNEVKRKTQLGELSQRGTTTAQKIAITNFTTQLSQALDIKNKAIDSLLISHRDEIDRAVIARKDFINKALTTLKTDIETAKTKAKSDCVSGVPGKTVRIDLKNSIQKAQKNFKKTVSSLGAIKESVTVNNDTKKTELKKIEDAFKKSIEQARVDLKNALKQRTATAVATTTQ